MVVLEEKGLQGYQHKMISFSNKEHKGEDVMKINPRGQVPTFRHGDIVINESMAICEYLESVYSGQGTKLIPDDQVTKARVLQRMHEALNIQKRVNEEVVYYLWRTKPEDQNPELLKTKKQTASEEFQLWEKYLAEMGAGSFIAGKDFSMADITFYTLLAFTVRMGLDLSKYPHLGAYYTMVSERPSIKASWPPHWKDSEGSKILSDI
jgi:glutathione S-transferase